MEESGDVGRPYNGQGQRGKQGVPGALRAQLKLEAMNLVCMGGLGLY